MKVFRWTFLIFVYRLFGTVTFASPQTSDEPLMVTPLIKANKLEEARNLSRVPPLLDNIESFSGFFTVNETTKSHLFFWFFPKTNPVNASSAPVVLWLGGGPGSSSLFGLFTGTGPFTAVVVGNSTVLERRSPSWTDDYHMLYIDQPVDAGFSFTTGNGYIRTCAEAAEQLYVALVQFFDLFPQYSEHDFYIAGESYAGKYIPAIGVKVHREKRLKLKGMIIGNGFTDPENMLDYDELMHGVGLIYQQERVKFQKMQNNLKSLIRSAQWVQAHAKFWELVTAVQASIGSANYYDYRRVDQYSTETYSPFVEQDHVRRSLHVGSTEFTPSSKRVEKNFDVDFLQSARPWVEELLEHYPILFYTGVFDIVCSPLFTGNFVNELHWSGALDYADAEKQLWKEGDQVLGYFKVAPNLLYVTVRGVGHSATIEQPENTRKLVKTFVANAKTLTALQKQGKKVERVD